VNATKWIATLSIAVFGFVGTAFAQSTTAPGGAYKVEEIHLGQFDWSDTLPGGVVLVHPLPPTPIISADRRHVGNIPMSNCPDKSRGCVVVDGQSIAELRYFDPGSLALSFDGKRVAYVVREDHGKKSWLVADGQRGPEYDLGGNPAGISEISFSPDGKRLAYVLGKGDRKHPSSLPVVDGVAGQEYDEVLHLAFSPDSRRVAYAARTGEQWKAVVDGQSGASYDDIFGPTFSPDSKRVAYGARQGKQWLVVADGRAGAAYDELFDFWRGTPNSVQQADLIEAQWLNMDGQSQVPYAVLSTQDVGFLESQSRLKSGVRYQYATRLVFSSDSKHLAYAAKRGGKWVVVLDGQEGAEYHDIGVGSPAFSPDGKRIAYSAKTDAKAHWVVVVDGQAGPEFEAIFNPSFSPDGKHLAYAAVQGKWFHKQWALVVDGQAGEGHSAIGNWAFSLDGKHLAYVAEMSGGNETCVEPGLGADPFCGGKWAVVVDGQAGTEYSVILPGTLLFGSDGVLEFLAVQKEDHSFGVGHHGSLYRVKYTPAK